MINQYRYCPKNKCTGTFYFQRWICKSKLHYNTSPKMYVKHSWSYLQCIIGNMSKIPVSACIIIVQFDGQYWISSPLMYCELADIISDVWLFLVFGPLTWRICYVSCFYIKTGFVLISFWFKASYLHFTSNWQRWMSCMKQGIYVYSVQSTYYHFPFW